MSEQLDVWECDLVYSLLYTNQMLPKDAAGSRSMRNFFWSVDSAVRYLLSSDSRLSEPLQSAGELLDRARPNKQ